MLPCTLCDATSDPSSVMRHVPSCCSLSLFPSRDSSAVLVFRKSAGGDALQARLN